MEPRGHHLSWGARALPVLGPKSTNCHGDQYAPPVVVARDTTCHGDHDNTKGHHLSWDQGVPPVTGTKGLHLSWDEEAPPVMRNHNLVALSSMILMLHQSGCEGVL